MLQKVCETIEATCARAERVTKRSASYAIPGLVEKMGDVKVWVVDKMSQCMQWIRLAM